MTKSEIRKTVKNLLSQNKSSFNKKSVLICQKILESTEYKNADNIFAYMALPDEVDLSDVIKAAFEDGKNLYLPKVMNSDGEMIFGKVDKNQLMSLKKGSFGILEPDLSNCENLDFNQLSGNSLVLTPGRAFSKDGKRVGRGKGYYDRFFASIPSSKKVTKAGICFSCQLFEDVPCDEHDVVMDLVFYESCQPELDSGSL